MYPPSFKLPVCLEICLAGLLFQWHYIKSTTRHKLSKPFIQNMCCFNNDFFTYPLTYSLTPFLPYLLTQRSPFWEAVTCSCKILNMIPWLSSNLDMISLTVMYTSEARTLATFLASATMDGLTLVGASFTLLLPVLKWLLQHFTVSYDG